jgi:hypothetical protein
LYEKNLQTGAFSGLRNKDCLDYLELKELHKKLRQASIVFFREKAVG